MISREDVITAVIRDHLSPSCPNGLNKAASVIMDWDCAEDGSDLLQSLDAFIITESTGCRTVIRVVVNALEMASEAHSHACPGLTAPPGP